MSQRDSGPSDPDPGALTPAGEPAPEIPSDRVVAMTRATIRSVDFRRARFDRFTLAGCLFVSCDFRGIRFDRRYQPLFASIPGNVFRDCRFDGADLRRVRPEHARFERCTFDDAGVDGWRTEAAELVGCRFAGPLQNVRFHGRPAGAAGLLVDARRKRNEFIDNDFRDADLVDVVFVGIDLARQRLPLSDRYIRLDRFPQRLAHARGEVDRWDVQEERVAAVGMLRALSARWRDQQEIIELRVRANGPPARVQTRVWALLERSAV